MKARFLSIRFSLSRAQVIHSVCAISHFTMPLQKMITGGGSSSTEREKTQPGLAFCLIPAGAARGFSWGLEQSTGKSSSANPPKRIYSELSHCVRNGIYSQIA